MLKPAIALLFLVAGIIHLLPITGVLGASRLTQLYGVAIDEPNLVLLMRHRAVLFALLGALPVCAVFQPELRSMALIAGLISTVSFLILGWGMADQNLSIRRVMVADAVAVGCLIAAAVLSRFSEAS